MDSEAAEELIQAIQSRNRRKVQSLLATYSEHGFDINRALPDPANGRKLGWTPLFWVVMSGDQDLLQYFLRDLRANPNVLDAEGRTPAHRAVHVVERTDALRTLILFGCDVTLKDIYGLSIIDLAGCNYGIGNRESSPRVKLAKEMFWRCCIYKKMFVLFVRDKSPSGMRRLPNSLLNEVMDFLG